MNKLAETLRQSTEKDNKLITEGTYKLASNPHEKVIIPETKEEVPHFNFAPLDNSLNALNIQAAAFEKASKAEGKTQDSKQLNALLKDMERSLTREHGLPGRPWYRHHIYAPGFYTGYGVKTLPGVTEAIEQRKYSEVNEQVGILADILSGFTENIEKAVTLMEAKTKPTAEKRR